MGNNFRRMYFPSFNLFGLILFACGVYAQPGEPDSIRLVSYADKFIVKANLSSQTDIYRYRSLQNDDRLELEPNTSIRLLLSLDYEFIGASLGFAPGFLNNNNDRDLKGKSSFSDYRFRFFLGKWVQGLQYRRVQGYYVENTGDFFPGWQEGRDPYVQFPDLRNTLIGMSTSYVFNDNFSLRNVLYQTEWQKVSAGSFIPTLSYDFSEFSFREEGVESKERNLSLRISPAYYYTLVFHENWYLSASLGPSLGVRRVWSRETDEGVFRKEQHTLATTSLGSSLQLGYSSERLLFGLNVTADAYWYRQRQEATVENDQAYAVLFLGYRFDAPAFARRTMDWLYGR